MCNPHTISKWQSVTSGEKRYNTEEFFPKVSTNAFFHKNASLCSWCLLLRTRLLAKNKLLKNLPSYVLFANRGMSSETCDLPVKVILVLCICTWNSHEGMSLFPAYRMFIYVSIYVYVHIYVFTYMYYVFIYVYICVCVYICMTVCVYLSIHMSMYT